MAVAWCCECGRELRGGDRAYRAEQGRWVGGRFHHAERRLYALLCEKCCPAGLRRWLKRLKAVG